MRQESGFLSATWDRITVVCQLHETGYRFSTGNVCTLSVAWSGMAVVCQLHEAGWRLPIGVYNMSVTWGRLAVVCSSATNTDQIGRQGNDSNKDTTMLSKKTEGYEWWTHGQITNKC